MTPENLLLGPASLDRYLASGSALPGGGALNMAYHWSRLGLPFCFLTRIGNDEPQLFEQFFERNGIVVTPSLVAEGASSSIDITIGDDRQPWMDNFVDGVWATFRLTAAEEVLLSTAKRLHVVLVNAAARELHRLGAIGKLNHLQVSGDFLDYREYVGPTGRERFEAAMEWLSLAFIGWPGERDDPTLDVVRDVILRARKLAVITMGARGVLLIDGRVSPSERFVSVDVVAVAGTTVGCGDAFIASFLAAWWASGQSSADLLAAVAAGAAAGAAATAWLRPLPEVAYVTSPTGK